MDLYNIHLLHVLLSFLLVNYPFLVKQNSFYDFIYIVSLFILLYSYILLKGECFISYAIKKYRDANYVTGSNVSVINDYSYIFKSKQISFYFIIYILITFFITSFIALKRYNFINVHYIYLFSILLIIYFILIKIKGFSNSRFYFNIVFMIYITFLLYRVFYHKMKKM